MPVNPMCIQLLKYWILAIPCHVCFCAYTHCVAVERRALFGAARIRSAWRDTSSGDTSLPIGKRVDALIGEMTLAEKVKCTRVVSLAA